MLVGSPSSVLTLGLGAWGSSSLLVTLGLGSGEAGVVVPGPYRTVAWQYFVPGSDNGQSHSPGSTAYQSHSPGSVKGQSV